MTQQVSPVDASRRGTPLALDDELTSAPFWQISNFAREIRNIADRLPAFDTASHNQTQGGGDDWIGTALGTCREQIAATVSGFLQVAHEYADALGRCARGHQEVEIVNAARWGREVVRHILPDDREGPRSDAINVESVATIRNKSAGVTQQPESSDPVSAGPGDDPRALRREADIWRGTAATLNRQAAALAEIHFPGNWRGAAADKFLGLQYLTDEPNRWLAAGARCDRAADALIVFANTLEQVGRKTADKPETPITPIGAVDAEMRAAVERCTATLIERAHPDADGN